MPLPDFNEFGDLPVGRHAASIDEALTRFGSGTPQRQDVTNRLRRIKYAGEKVGQALSLTGL
jgi:hypothetical protein